MAERGPGSATARSIRQKLLVPRGIQEGRRHLMSTERFHAAWERRKNGGDVTVGPPVDVTPAHDRAVGPPIACPACGGVNDSNAVFCANAACHKALGGFSYVLEELERDTSRIAKLAERVAELSGKPHFVTLHIAWFAVWIAVNSGLVAFFGTFDSYPYALLGIILSIEGILITLFLLVSSNRHGAHAEKRAALDYEVNVRTWRLVNHLADRLDEVSRRLARLER
jgi:uncharacterized membrane protein